MGSLRKAAWRLEGLLHEGEHVLNGRLRMSFRPKLELDKPREALGMDQVALDFMAPPPQPLKAPADALHLRQVGVVVPVEDLEAGEILAHELETLVVVARGRVVAAAPGVADELVPEQAGGQQRKRRMIERLGPGAKDLEVWPSRYRIPGALSASMTSVLVSKARDWISRLRSSLVPARPG